MKFNWGTSKKFRFFVRFKYHSKNFSKSKKLRKITRVLKNRNYNYKIKKIKKNIKFLVNNKKYNYKNKRHHIREINYNHFVRKSKQKKNQASSYTRTVKIILKNVNWL